MHHTPKTYQSLVLEKALLHVPFDGWTMKSLQQGAKDAGLPETIIDAVFPAGIADALAAYALMMDDRMMERLMAIKPQPQKISEKISQGVLCRFEALMPHKEAEKMAVTYWLRPIRKWQGAKILWRTADRLWVYAGIRQKIIIITQSVRCSAGLFPQPFVIGWWIIHMIWKRPARF